MITIAVDKLEPGMVLAQDIKRSDGMLLAGSGNELTAGVIQMIRRMVELETVAVEGSPFKTPQEAEEWKQKELKKLVRRFSKVTGDPFMDKLRMLEAKRIVDST